MVNCSHIIIEWVNERDTYREHKLIGESQSMKTQLKLMLNYWMCGIMTLCIMYPEAGTLCCDVNDEILSVSTFSRFNRISDGI